MVGPSGFIDRFKGKVATVVGGMYIGGTQVTTSGADQNVDLGWATVVTSTAGSTTTASTVPASVLTRAGGIDIFVPPSSGAVIFLANPVPGVTKILHYSTINASTGIKFRVSTTAGVTIQGAFSTLAGGSSLSVSITSTVSITIELLGLSTTQYLFGSAWPGSTYAVFAAAS